MGGALLEGPHRPLPQSGLVHFRAAIRKRKPKTGRECAGHPGPKALSALASGYCVKFETGQNGWIRTQAQFSKIFAVQMEATASWMLLASSSSVRAWVTTGRSRHSATYCCSPRKMRTWMIRFKKFASFNSTG